MRSILIVTGATLIAAGAVANASGHADPFTDRLANLFTNTFTIDCDRGQTIARALELGDFRKPLVINLRGTCREVVRITRANVRLHGDPAATILAPTQNADLVTIEADGVTLDNLTLSGGAYGVRNNHAFRLIISNCVVQGTGGDGIHGFVGDTRLMSSTIRNAGGAGVSLARGASLGVSQNSQILGNAGAGVSVERNSTVVVSGSTISGNGAEGVVLANGSYGSVSTSVIESNGADPARPGAGITVRQSEANVGSGNTVRNNRADGVLVEAGGSAFIRSNTITANGAHGVNAYLGSLLVLQDNDISDNTYSGVVGYAHSTVQIAGTTIRNNKGGAGISMMLGSKLMLVAPTTVSQGNIGALWCGDQESSVNDLSLLDPGGDTVFCSGY